MIGGRIAGLVTCLLCAIPFWIIGHYKDSRYPIGIWTEDSELSAKIHPVEQFNQEMSKLYLRCALVFGITGLVFLLHVMTGFILLMLECTVGLFAVTKKYKAIILKYSR